MSLTNEQITAQNFKDFYNGIRPYLNGQVPTFANAFNKSDLYSTDEKIVGCWIDGKPLYQKAFQGSWSLSASGNPTILSDVTIANGERLVSVELIQESSTLGDNYMAQVAIAGINQQYKLRLKPTNDLTASTIVVKYTKTTDTAVKVGDGNDYSTDEQIIGTWIDGKPLYQKTINFGALPNSTTKNVAHGIQNISYVVNISGIANDGTKFGTLPQVNDVNFASQTLLTVDSTYISIRTSSDRSVWSGYVTIQYTKTTD